MSRPSPRPPACPALGPRRRACSPGPPGSRRPGGWVRRSDRGRPAAADDLRPPGRSVESSSGRGRPPAPIPRKRAGLVSLCDPDPARYRDSPGRRPNNLRHARGPARHGVPARAGTRAACGRSVAHPRIGTPPRLRAGARNANPHPAQARPALPPRPQARRDARRGTRLVGLCGLEALARPAEVLARQLDDAGRGGGPSDHGRAGVP